MAFGMKALTYFLVALLAGCAGSVMDTVAYRGETIPLYRAYADFDEYKDEENNLPASQIPKVAALVRGAPVASSYPSREAALQALFDLMFPGYGFSAMNLGGPVALFAIEVPRMHEQRYLAFVQKENAWVLVEDFVWPDAEGFINAAELSDGRISYLDHRGQVVREHEL
jgi:hypothetical protein